MLRLHKKIVQTNIFRDIYLPISIYDRKNQIQIQHHVKKPYFQSRTSKIIKHVFFARMCFIHLTVNSRKADQKYSYYLFALIIFLIYKIFYVKLISRQNKHYYGCYSSMYQFRARILLLREISCFSNDCDFPGLNRSSMAGLAGWLAGKVNMIND